VVKDDTPTLVGTGEAARVLGVADRPGGTSAVAHHSSFCQRLALRNEAAVQWHCSFLAVGRVHRFGGILRDTWYGRLTAMLALLDGTVPSPDDLTALGLTNFGHYTSMRAEGQTVRGLVHHLDRITRDCRTVFNFVLDRELVRQYITQAAVGMSGSYSIRVTVFDPDLEMGRIGGSAKPRVLVTTRPAGALPALPLSVRTVDYVRDLPHVKNIGLFGAMYHRRVVQQAGFDDVLFTTGPDQLVTEGATWNVGFCDGENVIWPDAEVLPGVTMSLLRQVHDQTIVRPVKVSEIPDMRAAFATNTTVGVRPIRAINGISLPVDDPIFDVLSSEYLEIPAVSLSSEED
jgi:branched-subunit amino acid aminotransferase/4-amino-4-deoxychorismate lyase